MLVNNEIGTINPLAEIAGIAHQAGALVLCDAVQAYGRIAIPDCADLIAISAHKIHGPKGIGALWVRDGVTVEPLLYGGGQEQGLRSGTLARAMRWVRRGGGAGKERREAGAVHVAALWRCRARAVRRLDAQRRRTSALEGQSQSAQGRPRCRAADERVRDVCFSAGSACASGSGRPSHVLRAIGLSDAEAKSSIRLGFGRYTTLAEIESRSREHHSRRRCAGIGMVRVIFIANDGNRIEAEGEEGTSLLDCAQAAGMPLEGTCEGQMACSTCHVVVDPEWFARLKQASEDEEDMLDLAAAVERTSRLSCQIVLGPELDGLTVRVPPEHRDMQGR